MNHLLKVPLLAGRAFSSSSRQLKNRVPEAQKLFQADNGLPVHIKGGTSDVLLYRATMTLSIAGDLIKHSILIKKFIYPQLCVCVCVCSLRNLLLSLLASHCLDATEEGMKKKKTGLVCCLESNAGPSVNPDVSRI
uniref:Cytochrome c oxidase subunit 7A1, mitochondrial n=1 Tax=Nothobranchius furzeri TaxID=105023 RepID=A0A8C6K7I3_NOTFU